MTEQLPPLRNVTGRRVLAAFGGVLLLFAAALAVELVTLRRIAAAEDEVSRLDHAKHAGHMAAAEVRDQYIHQAHALIEFGPGHLEHYGRVRVAARDSILHLQTLADTDADRALAGEIARLAEQNDRDFQTLVVPAIRRGDRSGIADLGAKLETVVDQVVELNAQFNAGLEVRSGRAHDEAERLRRQAVAATIACFALAILLAAGLGLWLTHTIVQRMDSLRRGTRRLGAGDLDARIELTGRDEFAELAASFNQMAASLAQEQAALVRAQKLASIGQVAAAVAHELNNPLSVILGYTKLLRAEGGEVSEELRIVHDEARLCQRIVQELLDVARPHRLEVAPVELGELVREAVDRLADSGALSDRRVEVIARPPVVVTADAGKLRQVIANVVMNASEASPADGRITIDTSSDRDHGTLTVSDDGPGISAEIRQQIFEPFVTTKPNGTGLGLAIAHAIIEAHGGTISIKSSGAHGTVVSLQLPISAREEPRP